MMNKTLEDPNSMLRRYGTREERITKNNYEPKLEGACREWCRRFCTREEASIGVFSLFILSLYIRV